MFYYIKARKKGSSDFKSAREDRKIMVFNSIDAAKKHADAMEGFACSIISISCHPTHRNSQIHGKCFKKIGW